MKNSNYAKHALLVIFLIAILAMAVQGTTQKILRANACNLDSVCEANRIGIGTTNLYQNAKLHILDHSSELKSVLQNTMGRSWIIVQSGPDSEASISFQGENTQGSWWTVGSARQDQAFVIKHSSSLDAPGRDFTIAADGKVYIDTLKGWGQAYACVDSRGGLFRSQNPCNSLAANRKL
jgi:hypothetical protein